MTYGKRKICFVITSRAHYGRLKSVLLAVKKHPQLHLQLVVGASAVLRNFGEVVDLLKADGFVADAIFYSVIEGENPIAMAKTTGMVILDLATIFSNLKPDIVFLHADRYEVLAGAIAASYLNIMVAHNQGGEVSGTIDEHVRHAVTKLAHLHFTTNNKTAERIIKMGENSSNVFTVGCPSLDLIKAGALKLSATFMKQLFQKGVGQAFDLGQPYLAAIFHPVTTDYGQGQSRAHLLLEAVTAVNLPTIWFWPNVDAGSDEIVKALRLFREQQRAPIYFLKNLSPEDYLRVINNAACCIGNSSSFIREGSFLGVPAVIVGNRQTARERGANVVDVNFNKEEIVKAVKKQIKHGHYNKGLIYGDGKAAKKIVDVLVKTEIFHQKRISY